MEQGDELGSASESIFELQEVPGPVFALKQQGNQSWVPDKQEGERQRSTYAGFDRQGVQADNTV